MGLVNARLQWGVMAHENGLGSSLDVGQPEKGKIFAWRV
jgi:hypothetical protein